MNVLVIYSNPPGTERIRLDKEDKVFFKLGRAFPNVCIDRLHASEVDDIHEVISAKEYDVVQFSGHGSREGMFLCKDDISEAELVSPSRLSLLLQLTEKDPTLVILLSCYSYSLLVDFSLLAPFVVTSRESISDDCCILFVQGFFESFSMSAKVGWI